MVVFLWAVRLHYTRRTSLSLVKTAFRLIQATPESMPIWRKTAKLAVFAL